MFADNVDELIVCIVSYHQNQNKIILPRYQEFRNFVIKKIDDVVKINKDAGIFICKKYIL